LDRSGSTVGAMAMYRECEKLLDCGIQAAAAAGHMDDQPKLVQHRKQVHDRIEHLSSLGGHSATIPVEKHIKPVELSMKHTGTVGQPGSSTVGDGTDRKTLAVYAAVGAGAGFLVLGSTLAIVGGAAGGAYLATRQGNAGEVAEKITEAGNKALAAANSTDEKLGLTDKFTKGIDVVVQKGKEIDEKHNLSDKVAKSVDVVIQKGREVDDKHSFSDRIAKGVDAAVQKGKAIDDRHGIGDKVTQGVSTVLRTR